MRGILVASAIALAAAQPEQISVNFGTDGVTTSLSFSWAVPGASGADPAGVVSWGYLISLGNSTPADVRRYSDTGYESPALYNATVAELIPGAKIFYSVGDSRGFSTVATVDVPLARGAFGTRLALLGDLGTTGTRLLHAASLVHSMTPSDVPRSQLKRDARRHPDGSRAVEV